MTTLRKCACIDSLYTELPFYDRFAAAKSDGFEAVEFWNLPGRWVAETRRAAEKAEITIAGFNGCTEFDMLNADVREAYTDYIKSTAAAAKELRAVSLTLHSNALGKGGKVLEPFADRSASEKTAAMIEALRICADIAGEKGICLNLEPLNVFVDHEGCFLRGTAQAAEIIEAVHAPNLKILFDAYHMHLNGEDLFEMIGKYGHLFGHVHIADAPGRHEPGTGEISCPELLRALEARGYEGRVGFELFPLNGTAQAVEKIMAL